MTSYTKALAQSMQQTKDALLRHINEHLLINGLRRHKDENQTIHGAKDAIRKQTKTLR